jgi:hypothetical protein
MKKDKHITEVIFRKFSGKHQNRIIALFPYDIFDHKGNINSYMHIGQHGGANTNLIYSTKLATESEYTDLKTELESLGYNLKVIKKRNHAKYIKAYREMKKQYA